MENYREKLLKSLRFFRLHNHYAALFFESMDIEFMNMCNKECEMISSGDYIINGSNFVAIELPMENEIFQDIQLFIDENCEDYVRAIETALPNRLSLEEIQQFYYIESQEYLTSGSWTIRKIMDLAKDFSGEIYKIHEETEISIVGLSQIYYLMTSFREIFEDLVERTHDIKTVVEYAKISIPNKIPVSDRDDFLFKVSKRIHDLIVECFWVIYLVALSDLYIVLTCYEKHGFEATISYLLQSTPYPAIKEKVLEIKTEEELRKHIIFEFLCFFLFVPDFSEFLNMKISIITSKNKGFIDRKKLKTKSSKDKKVRMTQGDIDKSEERVMSPLLKNEGSDSNNDEINRTPLFEDSESELTCDGFDNESSSRGLQDKDHHKQTYKSNENADEEYRKYTESKKLSFSYDIFHEFERKMEKGLVMKYKLTGVPEKPLNYLIRALNNISHTVLSPQFDELVKNEYGISSRTLRRYKKDIKEGKIVLDSLKSEDLSHIKITDLSMEEFYDIGRIKELSRKHQIPGYMTQRQLVLLLRSNKLKILCEKSGIKFKILSSPTILSKLKKLIELKKIDVLKEKSAYHYKADGNNLLKIASEIMKLK